MKTSRLSVLSRIILVITAVLTIIALFVPIWKIELEAPQYPEGLMMEIWADKLSGDVEIINGLNHYIGMKTLHSEDFIEFKVLPYILIFFSLIFMTAAIMSTKKWLYIVFTLFFIFGIVSMVDFWLWEYDYGHNLDPNAAIKVPGMAYQPPLIGFKQLLNFGAFSIPSTGGWLILTAGILLLYAVINESGWGTKLTGSKKRNAMIACVAGLFTLASCGEAGPQPIKLNYDSCDYCRMTISDGKFGAESVTVKGRVYKFDDLVCMTDFAGEQTSAEIRHFYINDYVQDNILIDATNAWYIRHSQLKSPMAGNTAAFADRKTAERYASELNTEVMSWDEIKNENKKSGYGSHDHHH